MHIITCNLIYEVSVVNSMPKKHASPNKSGNTVKLRETP